MKKLILFITLLGFTACKTTKLNNSVEINKFKLDSTSVSTIAKDTAVGVPESKSSVDIPVSNLSDSTFLKFLERYPIIEKSGQATTTIIYRSDTIFIESKCDSLTSIIEKQKIEITRYQLSSQDSSNVVEIVKEVPRQKSAFEKFVLYWFFVTATVVVMYLFSYIQKLKSKFLI